MTANPQPPVIELEQALSDARAALLEGRLDLLEQTTLAISGCVDALTIGHPKAADIQRVRSLANRNAGLIEAAHRGLRLTIQRHAALKAGPADFGTYTPAGDRQVESQRQGYEHRS